MIPGHRSDLPHRPEAEQVAFFETVLGLTRAAEAKLGAVSRDLVIAGVRLRLVFAGAALEGVLLPAVSHRLASAPGTPDVTLHVWDTDSTGVEMCPPPVAQHCFSDRGDIWTFHSQRIRSAFHWSEFSLSLLDRERGEGVFWVRSATGLPYWTQASPFRTLFHWAMAERGRQLVHAAAVGTAAGGILITGRGGTGKSTTALACLAAGFDYVGDDYVLLSGDRPTAHSLYRTAKVEVADMARFERFGPRVLGDAASAGAPKAVMYLDNVADALPLVAVVTPRFGDDAVTGVEPIEPALLAGAATYTTLAQLPHAGQATVDLIADVLAELPGHRLVLGRDIARVPEAISALMERPAASLSPRLTAAALVSVIVPVFDGAHFLAEAVASVLAQGHPALEIIVVDDGSTDDLAAAVAALPVEVRFLRQPNGGPAAARNQGIRAASADLIAFVDVDDLWPAGRLAALQARLAEHPAADVVLGRAQLIEHGRFVGSPADSFACYIGAGLYRRAAFERNGLFDPLLRFAEDVDWFASADRIGLIVDRIEQVTLNVRRHPGNSTRGKTAIDLSPLHLARKALHRKRESSDPRQPAVRD